MKVSQGKFSLAAFAVLSALSATQLTPAIASESTGNIVGTVHSESSEGMTVTIKNQATGLVRHETVNNQGSFRFPRLPVGTYSVTLKDKGGTVVKESRVSVAIGATAPASFDLASSADAEKIDVVGVRIAPIDLQSVNSGLQITESELDKLPIARNATSVALLAPSVTQGDTAFGNVAAFAGASVAENAYYINGMNVTNFRNGLGGSTVPFEFYKGFQVKTGGYGAEFGRSLGGVINAVTKSGTNDFTYGANIFHSPDSLREDRPNTVFRNGKVYLPNDKDAFTETEMNIWAGGALVQDKLFYYVLFNPRDIEEDYLNIGGNNIPGGSKLLTESTDNAFWGSKFDWYITDDHHLEALAFSDGRTITTAQNAYNYNTKSITKFDGNTYEEAGGDNWSLKYTGYITPEFTISALYGKNTYDLTTQSDADKGCPIVRDNRPGVPTTRIGCDVNTLTEKGDDEREVSRLDFEWTLNPEHTLRFGLDNETLSSNSEQTYSGNASYAYNRLNAGGVIAANGYVNNAGSAFDYVSRRIRNVRGEFETEANAYYIEDRWSITEDVFLQAGLRNETFENKNSEGDAFISVDNQWAPRLGLTWDVLGEGKSKLFANWGRYYLPIANNTNVRLAGNELDGRRYFRFSNIASGTGIPTLGEELGSEVVLSDGSIAPAGELRDADLEPMFQDEVILGYQMALTDSLTGSVRGIHRQLKRQIDDYCGPILKVGTSQHCALLNPGQPLTIDLDRNRDGVAETITFSPAEIGLPKAKRTYEAIEFELQQQAEDYTMQGSYTWSRSYGNTEGYVKSDNGQDDAGITQDFDFAELMDGADGYLPNDRRHTIKFFGGYNILPELQIGLNGQIQSGRPVNAFGIGHPNGGKLPYGDSYYQYDPDTKQYNRVARGDAGRTEWTTRFDLSMKYTTDWAGGQVSVFADVFNILDAQGVTEVYEFAESGSPGQTDARYKLPTSYQAPRSVRIGAELRF